MSFVSYSQNFEDVILWRSLKDIEEGFYIDVGANDPELDSVTKAFYDRGWSGINIEPVEYWFKRLNHLRPRDINLKVAAGNFEGEIEMTEVVGTGLSTSVQSIADQHSKSNKMDTRRIVVNVKPLDMILNEYPKKDIHFLKIDVEGSEEAVINGINLKKFRPWIILVEATKPRSQELNYESWEDRILSSDYKFVYFDGLNRFYVATEKIYLQSNFEVPPNFFDNFISAKTVDLQHRLSKLEQGLSKLEQDFLHLNTMYNGILNSRLWRMTWPYRFLGTWFSEYFSRK
jgi:FkbM family methyltransferase